MEDEVIKEQGSSKAKTCFVIMPISDHPEYSTGHFRRVYEYIIKPACKKAGYIPTRADDTNKSNDIVTDIIKKIIDSDMAICDMSSRNPNVFYELGLRHAFNLKTTLIKDKKTSRAFDIAGLRAVEYDQSLRVDEVEAAISAIADAITETENMKSDEANSTIQLLGLDAPAKKVEIKNMSVENATIMGEIRSLRSDIEEMNMSNMRERRVLRRIAGLRYDEPSNVYISHDDTSRRNSYIRKISLSEENDKEG